MRRSAAAPWCGLRPSTRPPSGPAGLARTAAPAARPPPPAPSRTARLGWPPFGDSNFPRNRDSETIPPKLPRPAGPDASPSHHFDHFSPPRPVRRACLPACLPAGLLVAASAVPRPFPLSFCPPSAHTHAPTTAGDGLLPLDARPPAEPGGAPNPLSRRIPPSESAAPEAAPEATPGAARLSGGPPLTAVG